MKLIKFEDAKPSAGGDRGIKYTAISADARHELKLLAAMNKCTMIEMLDVLLLHWCNFRSRRSPSDNIKTIAHDKGVKLFE
jgi:hypothetical protein